MFKTKSIAFRLSFSVVASALAVFALVLACNYYLGGRMVMRHVEENAEQTAIAVAGRVETVFATVEKAAADIAVYVETSSGNREEMKRYLKRMVEVSPYVYGSVIALEPGQEGNRGLFCPYYHKTEGDASYVDLGTPEYDYPAKEWFLNARAAGVPVWSEPYFDEGGGNIYMSTYSVPVYGLQDRDAFVGVVTADIALSWLNEICESMSVYENGYVFICSGNGTILAHRDRDLVMSANISDFARGEGMDEWAGAARSMLAGETGFTCLPCPCTGAECMLYHMPLGKTGWSIGVMLPRNEIRADLASLSAIEVVIGIAGALLLLAILAPVARSISIPVRNVTMAAEELSQGRLTEGRRILGKRTSLADGGTSNEVDRLCAAVGNMIDGLESLVAEVDKAGREMTTSAAQIESGARQLEATVTEQAASTNEVSATSREIRSTAGRLAETMTGLTDSTGESAQLAESGLGGVARVNQAMKSLAESSSRINDQLALLTEKTGSISQVTSTITKIALQTNLLSLNAALEAERAGEFGAGFSVVAEQIRRLADQTAVSALEIEDMVVEMQGAAGSAVETIQEYAAHTTRSSREVADLSDGLARIMQGAQHLGPEMEGVNREVQSQSMSAAQINEAMEQLNETARMTKDSLGDFNSVTEKLHSAVKALQKEISRFS